MDKIVGFRLRDPHEDEITQPWDYVFTQPCFVALTSLSQLHSQNLTQAKYTMARARATVVLLREAFLMLQVQSCVY